MDEDISIINSNTRNEKVRNFFVKNKNKIILLIIAISVVLIGTYSFDKYKTNKKIEISDKFNSTTLTYSENTKERTIKNLVEIINVQDPTYSPLSLYFIIDNKLISNKEEINNFFNILIEKTSLDEEIKNLIIYKKALYNADQANEGDLLKIESDFKNFVKLAYMAPSIHHSGGTVCEPVDLPVNKRHYDMVYAHMRYSDKAFMGSVTHPSRAQDTIEMCEILFGTDFIDKNTVCTSLINVNSPLVFDGTMLGALKAYAKANQAVIISPFIMSGATGPVAPIGTLTQALAEAMAGIALTQIIRPGVPVIMGLFAASLSMKSGAPTFGTPEPSLIISAAAQLARRLGVPFRSGGTLCGSKLPDAQAAYESANSMIGSMLSGVNFVLHSAGWLEAGLVSSYEKFMIDVDQLAMLQVFAKGYDLSPNGQAMNAIHEVGPDNHYLGCGHTQDNFETAFYQSPIMDYNSFEQWELDGSKDLVNRASKECKKWLEEYEKPSIDPGIDEALLDYIVKKKDSFPDSST